MCHPVKCKFGHPTLICPTFLGFCPIFFINLFTFLVIYPLFYFCVHIHRYFFTISVIFLTFNYEMQLWYYTITDLQTPARHRDSVPLMCNWVEMGQAVGSFKQLGLERRSQKVVYHIIDEEEMVAEKKEKEKEKRERKREEKRRKERRGEEIKRGKERRKEREQREEEGECGTFR